MYILGAIIGYLAAGTVLAAIAGKIYNRVRYHRALHEVAHRLEILKANNRDNKELVDTINYLQAELRGDVPQAPRGHV